MLVVRIQAISNCCETGATRRAAREMQTIGECEFDRGTNAVERRNVRHDRVASQDWKQKKVVRGSKSCAIGISPPL